MDLLSKYKWLWVIAAMIFVSVVISLIFLLINKCISSRGKHRISRLPNRSDFSVQSNKYQETNSYQKETFKANVPALPPRTQFLTSEHQSYENLAEEHDHQLSTSEYEQADGDYEQATPEYEQDKADYVQAMPDYEQDKADYVQATPDYEQDKADYEQATPDYEQDKADYEQATPDYEQDKADYEQATPDYEQDKADYEQATSDYEQDMPDYVKVDEEERILPPYPPYNDPDPAADNTSTEDYDDIGGEDDTQGEEDYDDVG